MSDAAQFWNSRFEADGYLFGTAPNAWLQRQVGHLKPGCRVLCVADGEGRNSVWLARQGFDVDAFDIAELGVRKAEALARAAGVAVHFEVADADGWRWPEAAYDAVVAIFVQFADPALRARMFERMQRALKPGGTLLLHGYTPKQLEYRTGGPPQVENLYTAGLLRASFASLQAVELLEYEDEVAEGAGHRGRSALIGLVARRR